MTLQKADPRQTVTFKADAELVEQFDDWIESSEYSSRSEAMRELIAQAADGPADYHTPRQPPAEDRLATAYRRLCGAATGNGVVRDDSAKTVVSSALSIPKKEVVPTVLKKLCRRGYLRRNGNVYGDVSWHVIGWSK